MRKTRKYANLDETKIDKISLALATSEDITTWSHGEVTKPETINYKSYKPERHGLFDELIFGPMIDYRCPVCGHKYKKINEGTICVKTELCRLEKPEILPKIARRNHMGHIHLNNPVVHFWYFKVDHSILAKLLGLRVEGTQEYVKRSNLENLIYYKSHIVLKSGGIKSLPANKIIDINNAGPIYHEALIEIAKNYEPGTEEREEIDEAIASVVEKSESKIGQDHGIDFYEFNDIIEEYSDAKIGTGSEAIEYLLKHLDLEKEQAEVSQNIAKINQEEYRNGSITSTLKTNREKLYKRLQVINAFLESGQKPTSMLIYDLPVIPADLRPLIQLDGGRHSTSDINELYRRVIIRNNRLKQWQDKQAPVLLIQNELRMIQEAVDALIDNARRSPSPVLSKDNRPFKSISDALTGKKGRFRQNLLGKRVDYSGRSVIVVGPSLKMHQCGIPREMAAKLFEPWIIHCLIEKQIATTIKQAKKMIEDENPVIWPYVAEAIKGRLVLLNRAPTLHRLSIQAFEPVLIRGKAMRLHPLVCAAFNADFDGDQMAVHVPVSEAALLEARELMLANKNILGPKDGEPIINPSQDMILGLYYLTLERKGALGEGKYFSDFEHMMRALEANKVDLHARVALPIDAVKDKQDFYNPDDRYIISSVGKFIFNSVFPRSFPFIHSGDVSDDIEEMKKISRQFILKPHQNIYEYIKMESPIQKAFTKKNIAKIVRLAFNQYVSVLSIEDIASVVDKLTAQNYLESMTEYIKLDNYRGEKLSSIHAKLLGKFTREEFELNYNENKIVKEGENSKTVSAKEKAKILDGVWFKYTNVVASILDKIKALGFKHSTLSGISISISDIIETDKKSQYIKEGDDYIAQLKDFYQAGELTDDDRYNLTIKKWTEVKEKIQNELKHVIADNVENPVIMMIDSGARGTINNYVQLAGMRGLMANNTKTLKADAKNDRVVRSTVEVPVKSSFLEGLTAYEFYSSTHGARKGLTDTALNTAKSGYLTRRLVDVAQNIVVKEENCGSDYGFVIRNIVDTKTKQTIVSMVDRIEGRFTNKDIFDPKTAKLIVAKDKLITPEIAKQIDRAGIEEVEIRSIFGCNTRNGVCKHCFGKDLATNRLVNIGEAVGIIAAQSIGEPGTQLTMRTFHSGGVAGVEDITGGFTRLIELIDAYEQPWGTPAVISPVAGKVTDIKQGSDDSHYIVKIKYTNAQKQDAIHTETIYTKKKLRIAKDDQVRLGQKLSEGPIILKDLLQIADAHAVQNYLLKEIQRIYRSQGIAISDKYIEIIVRQMMSKVIIYDAGDSKFFAGAIVDIFDYQEECGKLLSEGKRPAYGNVIIKGAKQTPLLSDSFLAAASYQETTKILVHAAISNQVDPLEGLKENIIVGKKIPAGTNFFPIQKSAKYDIKPSISYFSSPEDEDADLDFINKDALKFQKDLEDLENERNSESEETFDDSSDDNNDDD